MGIVYAVLSGIYNWGFYMGILNGDFKWGF